MKNPFPRNRQFSLPTGLLLLALGTPAMADAGLDKRLSATLNPLNASYQGYQQATVPENGHPKTYLLLDFDDRNLDRREDRQARIHRICRRVLGNRELVDDLSRRGVHMVSVAFSRDHQYDCL